ncbi:NACHT domain-containing protein [Micromonospora okii]|uniref:NACHT domain-containing protein n=1 Tax=Micromonospora okii TaxID=1182970 RepID=UPI001E3650A2|nr:AAA family ATPase [Micromonospora okii]
MPDTLSYADAVRLLGGQDSTLVTWFDRLTGGALLAASVPVPALLGIFDAKAEFVRLGHELMRGAAEKRSGLSRYGRSRRLEAAHAVLAVTAFFEILNERAPSGLGDSGPTREEQLTLAGGTPGGDLVAALFATAAPVPGPQRPYPELRAALAAYYAGLADRVVGFFRGLAVADRLDETRWARAEAALRDLPPAAVDRHRDLLTRLAVDFPEAALWLDLDEHEATRKEVRRLSVGLADLHRALSEISTGRAPDERRAGLAAAYAAELRRPVIASGDVPAGLTVPTLGEAYVPPLCRIAELGPTTRPADETWWGDQAVRDDLWQSLVVHLTSPGATRAPLLVLGQPGSGKSVLTKVVAARLPAADFLVVRVVLRDVYAAGELQDQIEQAVRDATGERLDWPALARSAGDALPVVLLDGFDELLQATGVSQTDYLRRVAAFQRREADQGRPVAVLVTSRTSVADRAQPPPGTVALRLEPFDDARVGAWLDTWNRVNATGFRARGVRPLGRGTALEHRELAEQPLLLLMLALYDAEGNELSRAGKLRRGELYERLLRRFARREVVKQHTGLPEPELDRAVEAELRRLAVVAFAMFNRRAQWVTSTELDADLVALPFGGTGPGERAGLRAPLAAAEVVLGRFFFVHRSRAHDDERHRETYEFLHATFGEYLVARLAAQVVDDLVARDAAAGLSWGGEPVSDDLLHALLSYAVLTTRATVFAFLAERLAGRDEAHRRAWADLLLRLFHAAPYAAGTRRYDDYRPRRLTMPARHAAYAANLLLLTLAAADAVTGRELFPEATTPVEAWRAQVGLWRAQLDAEEWESLSDLLALERLGDGTSRDVRVWADGHLAFPPELDVSWTLGVREGVSYALPREGLMRLRRTTHLTCDLDAAFVVHALEPMFDKLPTAFAAFPDAGLGVATSVARALVDAWLLPLRPATQQERRTVYLRGVRLALTGGHLVDDWDRAAFLRLLLDRLATDREVTPDVVADVLSRCRGPILLKQAEVSTALLRCAQRSLGADPAADRRIGEAVADAYLALSTAPWAWLDDDVVTDVIVRLHEVGLGRLLKPGLAIELAARYKGHRPDFVRRLVELSHEASLRRKHRQDGVAGAGEAGT